MPKRFPTRFTGPEDSPGFLLWQVANSWQRRQKKALEDIGLTHVQFVLLASIGWLTRQGESVTQTQLADHSKTDTMMTSQVVRALESRQLVVRTPHAQDSRAKCLTLTPAGEKLVARALPLVEQVDGEFFGVLDDRLPALTQSLRALVQALIEDDDEQSQGKRGEG